jgi:DNA repair protein RAD7
MTNFYAHLNLWFTAFYQVGNLTAQAIALKCSLEVLDLSFCRGLTDEALGLIVDSCSSLRILKLFGCTQVR